MILMIDNYDSFTYNIVQYLGELGATIEVHRNDEITLDQIDQLNPEKIVISPGPCTPNEAVSQWTSSGNSDNRSRPSEFVWGIRASGRSTAAMSSVHGK